MSKISEAFVSRRRMLALLGGAAGSAFMAQGLGAAPIAASGLAGFSDLGGQALAPQMSPLALPKAPRLIGPDDYKARLAKAAERMGTLGIDAVLLEPGASMEYLTGMTWRRSERTTALLITKGGKVGVVTPYFEEPSVRQSLKVDAEVRTWHEDESPFERMGDIMADFSVKGGTLAVEETVRYFVSEGIGAYAGARVPAAPVVAGLRMIKSQAEIDLMYHANAITLAAYSRVMPNVKAGHTPADIGAAMRAAMAELGGRSPWALVLVGKASAYPHGSSDPQVVHEGEVVLMDCGCSFGGYQADISRTFVFGDPTKAQREMWGHMRRGQDIVFEAAQIGTPAGKVDEAVRAYYESLGYGPDYQTPGLSHRTGHGIGMEGHEPINFVRGEAQTLQAGMCFSNEPGIYDFSRYGVRLEDCLYMTESGPRWFTHPPESIDKPLGAFG